MRACGICILLGIWCQTFAVSQEKAPAIKLETIKHAKLLDAIKAQKGKVVVIDFWGEFCLPCKMEFPHLVELHQKHAKKGVVCMSVSVDDPEDAPGHKRALKFLQDKKATFTNFLLDEAPKIWQDHWDINGPPGVFVFDQQGKQVGRFYSPDAAYTYADVEKLVLKLLPK